METRSTACSDMFILERDVCTEGSLVNEQAQRRRDEIPTNEQEAPSLANKRTTEAAREFCIPVVTRKGIELLIYAVASAKYPLAVGFILWLSGTFPERAKQTLLARSSGYGIRLSEKCMNDKTTRYILID